MAGLVAHISIQIENHNVVIKASEEGIKFCDRMINILQNMKLTSNRVQIMKSTSNIFQDSIKINTEIGQLEQKKMWYREQIRSANEEIQTLKQEINNLTPTPDTTTRTR